MKTKILLTVLVATVIISCGKDKFETKPTLTFKSFNTKVVPFNGTLVAEFEVTDKEGDIADSIFVRKIRVNKRFSPTVPNTDAFGLKLPSAAPNARTSFVEISMSYNQYLIAAITPPRTGTPPKAENDTLIFKFALKDKAKNLSDTITSDQVVVTRM